MGLFTPQPKDYMGSVQNWTDPYPTPIIEQHEGIFVVRDDLLKYGAKIRFADYLIRTSKTKEWVYGSSPRWGYAQVSLAYLCRRYKKRAVIFLPASKELHPYSLQAQKLGAEIIQVPVGFMAVTERRARDYVAADPERREMLPFGLAHPTVYGSIMKVARALPISPDEIWTATGSGTLNRGLQMSWPTALAFMVAVGHEISPQEAGRAAVIRHPLKFQQQCRQALRPPFPSVPEYDAKAWEYVRRAAKRGRLVLFWNVAG